MSLAQPAGTNKILIIVLIVLIIGLLGGMAYLIFSAKILAERPVEKQTTSTVDKQKELIEKRQQEIDKYLQQGKKHFEERKWDAAQIEFQKVHDIDPTHQDATKWLNKTKREARNGALILEASSLIDQGKLDAAEIKLKRVPDNSPYKDLRDGKLKDLTGKRYQSFKAMGQKACADKQYPECHKFYVAALKINPKDVELLNEVDRLEKLMVKKKIDFTPYKP
jgi:tetratricopeptide (TPR) repeat protein